jgi:hypothetical protein
MTKIAPIANHCAPKCITECNLFLCHKLCRVIIVVVVISLFSYTVRRTKKTNIYFTLPLCSHALLRTVDHTQYEGQYIRLFLAAFTSVALQVPEPVHVQSYSTVQRTTTTVWNTVCQLPRSNAIESRQHCHFLRWRFESTSHEPCVHVWSQVMLQYVGTLAFWRAERTSFSLCLFRILVFIEYWISNKTAKPKAAAFRIM